MPESTGVALNTRPYDPTPATSNTPNRLVQTRAELDEARQQNIQLQIRLNNAERAYLEALADAMREDVQYAKAFAQAVAETMVPQELRDEVLKHLDILNGKHAVVER